MKETMLGCGDIELGTTGIERYIKLRLHGCKPVEPSLLIPFGPAHHLNTRSDHLLYGRFNGRQSIIQR